VRARVSGVRSEDCRKVPLFLLVFAGRNPDALAVIYYGKGGRSSALPRKVIYAGSPRSGSNARPAHEFVIRIIVPIANEAGFSVPFYRQYATSTMVAGLFHADDCPENPDEVEVQLRMLHEDHKHPIPPPQ
jgi:hypothetical protein